MEITTDNKIAGILTPVSALRGSDDLGVGDTAALIECAAWAASKGIRLVQILPVNETGSDHSPYNILSSIAYEPATITTTPGAIPDLSREDFDQVVAGYDLEALRSGPVKHAAVKALKMRLLEVAFRKLRGRKGDRVRAREFAAFERKEKAWLEPYTIFRALVAWNGNSEVVTSWPEEHRTPQGAEEWISSLPPGQKKRFRDFMRFFGYVQWIARCQWQGVREACDRLGVFLMGDIPVGVSIFSADVWAEPGIFDTTRSSGAPPERVFKSDPFTERWGQNWGFPLYNWEEMSRDHHAWWRRRLRAACEVFHFLRVDHALGFFRIYSFPWRPEDNAKFTDLTPEEARALTGGALPGFVPRDDSTWENQEFNRSHGEAILKVFLEETGKHRLVAEDLGEVAPYVRPVLAALEVPGFKIPQWERGWDGKIIPGAEYQRLSLATFATHDHPPLRQFWEEWNEAVADPSRADGAIHAMWEMMNFCGRPEIRLPQPFTPEIHATLLRGLFRCNSWFAVHQITDVFGLRDRFNVPGAIGDANWTARINGKPSEWDVLHPVEVNALQAALRETGRHPDPAGGLHE